MRGLQTTELSYHYFASKSVSRSLSRTSHFSAAFFQARNLAIELVQYGVGWARILGWRRCLAGRYGQHPGQPLQEVAEPREVALLGLEVPDAGVGRRRDDASDGNVLVLGLLEESKIQVRKSGQKVQLVVAVGAAHQDVRGAVELVDLMFAKGVVA